MRLRGKIILLLAFCFSVLFLCTWIHRDITDDHLAELEVIRSELYPASYLIIEAEYILGQKLKKFEESVLQDDHALILSAKGDIDLLRDYLERAKEKLSSEPKVQAELELVGHYIELALKDVATLYGAYLKNQLDSDLQQKVLEQGKRFESCREKIKKLKWRTQEVLDLRLGLAATEYQSKNRLLRVFDYVIVLFFMWISFRIYKTGAVRVSMLAESTRSMSYQMDVPITIDEGKDEVTELAMSLESMRKDVLANQQALDERRQQAEEALRVKGDFLSNMSHELRTPLNAILGMAGVLDQFQQNHQQQAEYQSCVSSIKRAGQHLLDLINDVLDLSKLEAGKVILKEDPISMPLLLDELKVFYKSLAEKNENVLSVQLDPHFPSLIVSDAKVLRQIMTNLVGNAIKFTKNGQVTMGAKLVGDGKVNLYVKDTGIGISEANLAVIFDQFKQVEDAHTKSAAGTGLGLAICLQLSKLLGGELSVESGEGEGSLFSLKFKPKKILVDVNSNEKSVAEIKPLKSLSILAVEDNEDNTLLLKMYFKKMPHRVMYCANGQLGLEAFQANIENLDLVISDMQMPVIDGYTSVRKMREYEREHLFEPMKIVALTAFAAGDDEKKCFESGCDAVYHKPISKADFRALLEKEGAEAHSDS